MMNYLTKTGITLLDLIDFRDAVFFDQLNSIYNIRFSYAERIQATRLMKVKNNLTLLTQCPNGKQRLIRFSLNCLNFAVKKVFHSFSCAEQLCFGMMWAVKQSAFLT